MAKKTKIIEYLYDPIRRALTITEDGKPLGGFTGDMAEKEFERAIQRDEKIYIMNHDREPERRQKVKRLRALWITQGVDNYREAILEPYGVTSTADLTNDQLDDLITIYTADAHKPVSDETRKLRSQVLTLLQKLGIYATNDDWHSVNRYLMNPRIAGKLLYQMNDNELQALTRKLRAIIAKEREKLDNELKLSMMN